MKTPLVIGTNGMDLLLNSLKPFVCVAKCYGVLPFSFKSPKVMTSVCGLIYGVIISTVTTFYPFMCYVFLDEKIDFSQDFFYRVVKTYMLISSAICLATFLCYVSKIRRIRKLYERTLRYANHLNNEKFRKNVFLLMIGEIISFILISLIYHVQNQLYFIYSGIYDGWINTPIEVILLVIEVFSEHYLFFLITLINLQFANIVLFYSFLFRVANNDLKQYMKSRKSWEIAIERTKKVVLIDDKGDASKLVDYYDEVGNLCRHANLCFNETLVLTSVFTFISVLLSLYLVINKLTTVGIFIFDYSYSVYNLWCILYSCESVSYEVSVEKTLRGLVDFPM